MLLAAAAADVMPAARPALVQRRDMGMHQEPLQAASQLAHALLPSASLVISQRERAFCLPALRLCPPQVMSAGELSTVKLTANMSTGKAQWVQWHHDHAASLPRLVQVQPMHEPPGTQAHACVWSRPNHLCTKGHGWVMGWGTVQFACIPHRRQVPKHIDQAPSSPAGRLRRCAHTPHTREPSPSLVVEGDFRVEGSKAREAGGAQACWCRETMCCSARQVMLSNPG